MVAIITLFVINLYFYVQEDFFNKDCECLQEQPTLAFMLSSILASIFTVLFLSNFQIVI
jgi:hypothetical protein